MWSKYLLSGVAAVFILADAAGVTHAAQMPDGGQPVNEAAAFWEQDADANTPETAQADTYGVARSTSGKYKPYEGSKYSLKYEVRNEGVVITDIADYVSKDDLGRLEIPAKINGVNVTGIGDSAFYGCSGLTGNLTIPENVTSIGDGVFSNCSGLTGSLTIPKSVTSIGSYAFSSCRGLTGSLTIPESVTSIGSYAFKNCRGLTGSLTIPESLTNIGEGAFEGCNFGLAAEPTYDAKGLAERFYTELLGRDGEADGIAGWTKKLETGDMSAIHAGYMFVDGDEFKGLNLNNDEYLERLYKTFMGRASDSDGKAFWLERLDAGFTRDYVYLNFAVLSEFTEICEKSHIRRGETDEIGKLKEASEAYANQNIEISKYVTRCYTKVLERAADAEGVEFWCGQVITKAIEAKTVAEAYVLSEEFVSRNKTDAEYIEVLYQTFFDRAGDETGTDYWLEQLGTNAMTREDVLHAFSATPEFADILAGFGL